MTVYRANNWRHPFNTNLSEKSHSSLRMCQMWNTIISHCYRQALPNEAKDSQWSSLLGISETTVVVNLGTSPTHQAHWFQNRKFQSVRFWISYPKDKEVIRNEFRLFRLLTIMALVDGVWRVLGKSWSYDDVMKFFCRWHPWVLLRLQYYKFS